MQYLAKIQDLAALVGVPTSDPKLVLALKRASDRFEDRVDYSIRLVENDVVLLSGRGTPILLLPARYTVGTPTIKVNGEPVTDFQIARDSGILHRSCGWPRGLDNVEVTYTHGFAEGEVPGGIQDAVLEQAETNYHVIVGFQSRAAGSESVTYSALAAVGVTQRWTDMVDKYEHKADDA